MDRYDTVTEVWDPLLRIFHWMLVGAFALAWWSEGRDIRIHLLAGSVIPGLLMFRLIWGVAGEHHALFASFRPSIAGIMNQLGHLLRLKAENHAGHTPIGSLMIYALLFTLLVLSASGMVLMALQMGLGPFAGWAAHAGFTTEVLIQQVHHWSFRFLQLLIAVHLGGVAVESLLQGRNLTAAMITGRKTLREVEL